MKRLPVFLLILFCCLSVRAQQTVTMPLIATVQKHAVASSGSVASLANAFSSNVGPGNSIVVSFCNGNVNAPTAPITDTLSSTWTKAVHQVQGSALECDIWYAVNVTGGAETVTVTPGGSNASIASEVYEISGTIMWIPAQGDLSTSSSGNSAAASATAVAPMAPNSLEIAAVGVGTAAQTITPASFWTNDSGQQNPATPSGLFSFISMSQQLDDTDAISPLATFTSEPWALAAAIFHAPILPIGGAVRLHDGSSFLKLDPCQSNNKFYAAINLTASGQIITSSSGKVTYICSLNIVTATAQNIALVEGTGSTCGTSTTGMAGGSTAATGWNFAANGGLTIGNGGGAVFAASNVANSNVCLLLSGTGQTSGSVTYVQQ